MEEVNEVDAVFEGCVWGGAYGGTVSEISGAIDAIRIGHPRGAYEV